MYNVKVILLIYTILMVPPKPLDQMANEDVVQPVTINDPIIRNGANTAERVKSLTKAQKGIDSAADVMRVTRESEVMLTGANAGLDTLAAKYPHLAARMGRARAKLQPLKEEIDRTKALPILDSVGTALDLGSFVNDRADSEISRNFQIDTIDSLAGGLREHLKYEHWTAEYDAIIAAVATADGQAIHAAFMAFRNAVHQKCVANEYVVIGSTQNDLSALFGDEALFNEHFYVDTDPGQPFSPFLEAVRENLLGKVDILSKEGLAGLIGSAYLTKDQIKELWDAPRDQKETKFKELIGTLFNASPDTIIDCSIMGKHFQITRFPGAAAQGGQPAQPANTLDQALASGDGPEMMRLIKREKLPVFVRMRTMAQFTQGLIDLAPTQTLEGTLHRHAFGTLANKPVIVEGGVGDKISVIVDGRNLPHPNPKEFVRKYMSMKFTPKLS